MHLNKLVGQLAGIRCEVGCMPFLDGLLTESQPTCRPFRQHLSRVLRVQGCSSSRIVFVVRLIKLHMCRLNLLTHLSEGQALLPPANEPLVPWTFGPKSLGT